MVSFVAKQAENTSNLSELGLFSSFKNVKRKGEGSHFDATKGSIDMHVSGSGMLFVLKKPVSGTVKSIQVKDGGVVQYTVSDMHLKLTKMQKFFKGSFEPKLFAGKDHITGSSQNDKLAGYKGNDTIHGGSGDDKIDGGKSPDKLFGDGRNDVILGGQGNDELHGGAGVNSLTGGPDKDKFVFDVQLNSKNNSLITDFTRGQDKIQLDHSVFPGLGGKGVLSNSHFITADKYTGQDHVVIYDKSDGSLAYSVNGGSIDNAFDFGGVSSGLNLNHNDFLVI